MAEILNRSMRELVRALNARETSAEALADEATGHHERFGEDLHAYTDFDADYALRQARAADAAFRSGFPGDPLFGISCRGDRLHTGFLGVAGGGAAGVP